MLHFRSVFGYLIRVCALSYHTIAHVGCVCSYAVLIIKTPINDISRFQKPRFAHSKYIITSHCCTVYTLKGFIDIAFFNSRLQMACECWHFSRYTLACASVNYTKIKYKNVFHTAMSESKGNRTLEMRWHSILCIQS